MHDFWNQVFLSNSLRRYAFVVVVIVVGLLIRRLLSKFIAGILYRIASYVGAELDKNAFVKLLIDPLQTFLLLIITVGALGKLKFPEELNFELYEISTKSIVHGIAKTVLIIVFIWFLLRLIDFVALLLKQRANVSSDMRDRQLVFFFRDFLKVIIVIIGILMVLSISFGVEVSKFWTSLGIAGAALALSARESIENLIASFIIFFDKPFNAGDILKVNNISGTVEKIGLRSTRIRTDQKTFVTVPNKQMVDSIVDNLSLRTQRKAEIRLQIALSADAGQLNQFIDGIGKILMREEIDNPTVFLNDIAGNAFLVNVDYFTSPITLNQFNQIKQEVSLEILRLMEKLGIQITGASTDVKLLTEEKVEKN
ncbi:MAG: mechanosensitive ion channel protein MscS [Bacteroidetes bacterium]|nr:MAG: mechanosensitive ion channel protein MscS [Bacteroidota bacterium]